MTWIVRKWVLPWSKTGATLYNAHLGLPEEGRASHVCIILYFCQISSFGEYFKRVLTGHVQYVEIEAQQN